MSTCNGNVKGVSGLISSGIHRRVFHRSNSNAELKPRTNTWRKRNHTPVVSNDWFYPCHNGSIFTGVRFHCDIVRYIGKFRTCVLCKTTPLETKLYSFLRIDVTSLRILCLESLKGGHCFEFTREKRRGNARKYNGHGRNRKMCRWSVKILSSVHSCQRYGIKSRDKI